MKNLKLQKKLFVSLTKAILILLTIHNYSNLQKIVKEMVKI